MYALLVIEKLNKKLGSKVQAKDGMSDRFWLYYWLQSVDKTTLVEEEALSGQ